MKTIKYFYILTIAFESPHGTVEGCRIATIDLAVGTSRRQVLSNLVQEIWNLNLNQVTVMFWSLGPDRLD
jgi:hypothetical protein